MLRSIYNVVREYIRSENSDVKLANRIYNKCLEDINDSLNISIDNFGLSPIETCLLRYELILSKLPKYTHSYNYFTTINYIIGFIDDTGLISEYTSLLREYNKRDSYLIKSSIFYYDYELDTFLSDFFKDNYSRESIINVIGKNIEKYKEQKKNCKEEEIDHYLFLLDSKSSIEISNDNMTTIFLTLKKKYELL